jgi:hypothetical protein
VITDLDSVIPKSSGIKVQPAIGKGYETGNTSLAKWIPAEKDLDALLSKVFTDKFVTIERKDNTIYGKGMVSDQNFTNYVINEVTGVIYLDEESK